MNSFIEREHVYQMIQLRSSYIPEGLETGEYIIQKSYKKY